ncbi:MAG: hypothetical protein V8T10_01525 [Merdibacter sp.]
MKMNIFPATAACCIRMSRRRWRSWREEHPLMIVTNAADGYVDAMFSAHHLGGI